MMAKNVYNLLRWPKSVKERSKKIRSRSYSLPKIPEDVLLYRINNLPAWARSYIHDYMGREIGDTITELADLRWQRDALIKLVEELRRGLKREKARNHKRAA